MFVSFARFDYERSMQLRVVKRGQVAQGCDASLVAVFFIVVVVIAIVLQVEAFERVEYVNNVSGGNEDCAERS